MNSCECYNTLTSLVFGQHIGFSHRQLICRICYCCAVQDGKTSNEKYTVTG
jgi:hypothetical protein